MSTQEILDKLPNSWSEFKLRDYIRSTQFERLVCPSEDELEKFETDVENMFRLVSSITDVPVDQLRLMPWSEQKKAMRLRS